MKKPFEYIKVLVKWLIISVIIGTLGGAIGSVFHILIDEVTELRFHNRWVVFLLPLGGLLITYLYRLFKKEGKIDTNRVILSIRKEQEIPVVMVPLIFVSTVITHFFGGSAGREGAALQLGGGIGYNLGRLIKLNGKDMHIIVRCGMAAVFSALFGTPLTAAIFSLEVIRVGIFNYAGLLPCIVSAITAFGVSGLFGLSPVRYLISEIPVMPVSVGKIFVLAILCAIVSILFCVSIHKTEELMKNRLKNRYLRTAVGAVLIVLLSLLFSSGDYNGAGTEVIAKAMAGKVKPEAFLIKIIFTAITIAAGFKGGEIVPAFFVGSTFGCVVAPLLGLDASFAAATGFISLFCGVVNCPLASIILAYEVFGGTNILFFAIACGVSYMMSGYFGLYNSQQFVYSKLTAEKIEK